MVRSASSQGAGPAAAPLLSVEHVTKTFPGQMALDDAFLSLYPGEDAASDETHIFHIPSNRIAAMQENIAWFDYWLLGKRDPGSPLANRYALWDKMRASAPRCDASGGEPDG